MKIFSKKNVLFKMVTNYYKLIRQLPEIDIMLNNSINIKIY